MAAISGLIPRSVAQRESYNSTRLPYYTSNTIDIEEAIADKGSALAAADTIQAIYIPAGTAILAAGIYVKTAIGGTVSACTLDLGITGGDVDAFVDGFDFDAASAGAYSAAPAVSANGVVVVGATADTLDILIATLTDVLSTGELVVWAILQDITPPKAPGIVALRS